METKKLFQLLTLVDEVQAYRWQTVCDIVDCFNEKPESVIVLSSGWHDDFKQKNPQFYPLDLSKIETWSTYDGCFDIEFKNKKGRIYCKAVIWDGNNIYGSKTTIRFTAEFILPSSFIKKIEDLINWKFEDYLENSYKLHLKAQKKLWINNLEAKILKNK